MKVKHNNNSNNSGESVKSDCSKRVILCENEMSKIKVK